MIKTAKDSEKKKPSRKKTASKTSKKEEPEKQSTELIMEKEELVRSQKPIEEIDEITNLKLKLQDEVKRLQDQYLRQKEEERRVDEERRAFKFERPQGSDAALSPAIGYEQKAAPNNIPKSIEILHPIPAPQEISAHSQKPSAAAVSAAKPEIQEQMLTEGQSPKQQQPRVQIQTPAPESIEPLNIIETKQQEFPEGSEDFSKRFGDLKELFDKINTLATERGLGTPQDAVLSEISNRINALEDGINSKSPLAMVENLKKIVERADEKIEYINEESGIGETLDVSKIPPDILESVYDATLEDIVMAITKVLGPHDTELLITKTIEDLRSQTSGSELFKYDEGDLKTKDLAKSLLNKLISPRQVHATYSELLNKLLGYAPHHKPKNFRAMIKLKSQEFAVDKATILISEFEKLRTNLDLVNKTQNEILKRLHDMDETKSLIVADLKNLNLKVDHISKSLSSKKERKSE